jgi:hypothetical protein
LAARGGTRRERAKSARFARPALFVASNVLQNASIFFGEEWKAVTRPQSKLDI